LPFFHYASESARGRGWTARISGAERPSQRATIGKEVPCNRIEVRTIKKTRLKIISAFGIPAMRGKVARIIGTAPRSPTHEIRSFSLSVKLAGVSVKNA